MADFDLSALIGMDATDASDLSKQFGYRFRITSSDGVPRVVTRDFRPDRVNVAVVSGKVVSADIG